MADNAQIRNQVRLQQLIDQQLDDYYAEVTTLGQQLGQIIGGQAGGNRGRSQLRNLESIVASATRTSALKNHVKNQTGKDAKAKDKERGGWATPAKGGESLGTAVLKLLDGLGAKSLTIASQVFPDAQLEEKRERARQAELHLQRGLVQTLVATALYTGLEVEE